MAAFLDSELTVVKNADGIPTALGYPILLNQNSPLFNGVGGGKKKAKDANAKLDTEPDYANLAIPAGLVCTTQTICRRPEMFNPIETDEIVPESLYDKLLALAEEQSSSARSSQQPPSARSSQPSASNKQPPSASNKQPPSARSSQPASARSSQPPSAARKKTKKAKTQPKRKQTKRK